jgi:hypothetical protein
MNDVPSKLHQLAECYATLRIFTEKKIQKKFAQKYFKKNFQQKFPKKISKKNFQKNFPISNFFFQFPKIKKSKKPKLLRM